MFRKLCFISDPFCMCCYYWRKWYVGSMSVRTAHEFCSSCLFWGKCNFCWLSKFFPDGKKLSWLLFYCHVSLWIFLSYFVGGVYYYVKEKSHALDVMKGEDKCKSSAFSMVFIRRCIVLYWMGGLLSMFLYLSSG